MIGLVMLGPILNYPARSTLSVAARDTRRWAALQDASGGTWGGSVFDVETILKVLAAGRRVLGE